MQQTILTRDEQFDLWTKAQDEVEFIEEEIKQTKEQAKHLKERLKDAKGHERKVRMDLRNGQLQLSVNGGNSK